MMKKLFHSQRLQCILLTIALLGGMLLELPPLMTLEKHVFDTLARLRRTSAERPVIIVAIDDRSIQQIGGWPWPRDYIADMIRTLSAYRTDTLGIALLYQEAGLNNGLQEIQTIKNLPCQIDGVHSQLAGDFRRRSAFYVVKNKQHRQNGVTGAKYGSFQFGVLIETFFSSL